MINFHPIREIMDRYENIEKRLEFTVRATKHGEKKMWYVEDLTGRVISTYEAENDANIAAMTETQKYFNVRNELLNLFEKEFRSEFQGIMDNL